MAARTVARSSVASVPWNGVVRGPDFDTVVHWSWAGQGGGWTPGANSTSYR